MALKLFICLLSPSMYETQAMEFGCEDLVIV